MSKTDESVVATQVDGVEVQVINDPSLVRHIAMTAQASYGLAVLGANNAPGGKPGMEVAVLGLALMAVCAQSTTDIGEWRDNVEQVCKMLRMQAQQDSSFTVAKLVAEGEFVPAELREDRVQH